MQGWAGRSWGRLARYPWSVKGHLAAPAERDPIRCSACSSPSTRPGWDPGRPRPSLQPEWTATAGCCPVVFPSICTAGLGPIDPLCSCCTGCTTTAAVTPEWSGSAGCWPPVEPTWQHPHSPPTSAWIRSLQSLGRPKLPSRPCRRQPAGTRSVCCASRWAACPEPGSPGRHVGLWGASRSLAPMGTWPGCSSG